MSASASSSRARSASPPAPQGFEWVEGEETAVLYYVRLTVISVSWQTISIIMVSCPACQTGKDDLNVKSLLQHWQSKHSTVPESNLYDYLKTRHVRRAARPTYTAWMILRAETPKTAGLKFTLKALTKTKLNASMVPCPFCPTSLTFSNLHIGTHTAGPACVTNRDNATAAIKASFSKMDKEGRWSYLCLCYNIAKTGSQPGKKLVDVYQLTFETPWRSPLPPLPQQPSASRVPSPPRPPSASAVDSMGKGKGVSTPLAAGPRAREASPGRGRAQQRERSRSRTPARGAQASLGAQPAAGPGTSTPPRAPSKHSRRSSSSSSAASMTSNPVENAASANTAWLQQQLGKHPRPPSSSGSSVAF